MASNLRIIHNNYVDTANSLTASTTAATFSTAAMQNEYKGQVHRSTGTTVTYTVNFSSNMPVGGVVLPATNLTASATIRVRLYQTSTLMSDSGTLYACPGQTIELWNWSMPLNANAFAFGGASKSAVWFQNQVSCNKIVIDLVDTSNPAGYIDCARIVAGPFWEPKYNAKSGISVTISDTSAASRNDAGDLVADRGYIHDMLSFDFSILEASDRLSLLNLMRKIGTARNFAISIFPDNNSVDEQTHLIYGKRTNNAISMELYGIYSSSMEIEGW